MRIAPTTYEFVKILLATADLVSAKLGSTEILR